MNAQFIVRVSVSVAAGCLLFGLCVLSAWSETPPSKPLTPEQQEKLKERNRLIAEIQKLHAAGKLAEAIAAVEKILAIERDVFGSVHPDVAASLRCLADLHERREEFDAARKARQEVLDITRRLYGQKHWRVTDARLDLGNLEQETGLTNEQRKQLREATKEERRGLSLHRQGKYREAVPLAQGVLNQRKSILGEQHRDYVITLNNLGVLYSSMRDYAKAEPLYRQALNIRKQVLGEMHPEYAYSLNKLAVLYDSRGDYTKAEPLYRQTLAIRKQVLGEKHPDYDLSLNNLAGLYFDRGAYDQAEPLYRQALEIRKQTLGEQHANYATSLNNLAKVYYEMGAYAKAEPLYQQALNIRKQVLGEMHPDYATSLDNLGELRRAMGEYTKAEPLYRQAVNIRKQVLGEMHPNYATSLDNLAGLYHEMGDYLKSEPLYRQALEITKNALGEKHPNYARSLNNLAGLYKSKGAYLKAESRYLQALEIQRQALREKHPSYATTLNNLADLYQVMGDYTEAEPLYRQVLAIRKEVVGEMHPDYATSLNNLAALHETRGQYAKAEQLYRQASAIDKDALGEKHPSYATSLFNLAGVYSEMGDYAKAEPLYQKALEIEKQALGKKHPAYATSLNALALLYGEKMGDYAKAEPLFRQSREIRKQALREKHPLYGQSLNNLASLYDAIGDYAKAEPLYREALEIAKNTVGEEHPNYATTLSNLATLYDTIGNYAKAKSLYQQTLEIRKQALGEKHLDYAQSLHNLAGLYVAIGDRVKAEPLYRQALDIERQAVGEKHSHYARSLTNLALLHLAKNDGAQSLKLARQAWLIVRGQLELTANVQSERQQLRMNAQLRFYLDNFLSVAAAAKAPAEEVYAEVIAWKGVVSLRQQQMRRMRRELAGREPQASRLYVDLEAATRRLATLINTTPASQQIKSYHRRLDDANVEVERLQKELATASSAFRKELEKRERTPDKLRQALPDSIALVDLVEYKHFTPQAKGRGIWEGRLAAFVVRKDRPVVWVDLGPIESLSEAVEQWRATISKRTRPSLGDSDPAVKLRQRLWQPLEPHLKDAATVLISPDGAVARLPWGALPGATPDKYLLEERAIAIIAVPQFLPELLEVEKKANANPPALLLVGDVDYGAAPGKADVEIASRGLETVLQRGGGASWKRLKATKQEAETIRKVFQRNFPAGTAKLLDEGEATEGAVREQAPRHAWLHLATHGYFAPQKVNAALDRDKRPAQPSLSQAEQRGFAGFSQGLLAGVVMAGANKGGGDGEDDGILTALEVAELDLRGCRLAVLSACETGLGEKAGGEGLLGIQRAFQVAGARSVTASLWQVPDAATRALMERFYDNLWAKKLSKLEALREAQLWMLREGQRQPDLLRGLDRVHDEPADAASKRLPPYYWAAFVLSGDWR